MKESLILGVSLRGWITFLVIYCSCIGVLWSIQLPEQFWQLTYMLVGFYFGQKSRPEIPPIK